MPATMHHGDESPRQGRKPDRALLALLVAFACLATTYSIVTPIFEAPDEPWHYRYVKHLADGRGLPPLTFSDDAWVQGENHQPPLYYLLGAGLTAWIDTDDLDGWMRRNPQAATGRADAFGNKNIVLHPVGGEWPYRGSVLAVHLVRLLSVACGAATVWATYALSQQVAPGRRWLALGAAALVAFNPQFLFISGAVNNDNLITALAALVLLGTLRLIKGSLRTLGEVAGLGLLVGLAALTKLSGVALLALVGLGLAIVALRERSLRGVVGQGLVVVGMVAGIAGWWYVRNAILYADPLGLRAQSLAFSSPGYGPNPRQLVTMLLESGKSFWGVFGWMNVLADDWVYTLASVLQGLAVIGWLAAGVRRWAAGWGGSRGDLGRGSWAVWLPLVVWTGLMTWSLAEWSRLVAGPQGRLLFPAIPAIAIFLAFGLASLPSVPLRRAVLSLGLASLALVAAIAPFRYIAPAYAPPPSLKRGELPAGVQPVELTYDGRFLLHGYRVDVSQVNTGERAVVTLYWEALEPVAEDYSVFVRLEGRDRAALAQSDSHPARGARPTSTWRVGEVIADAHLLRVAPQAAAPTLGRIVAGLYTLPDFRNLEATDPRGQPAGGSPVIGRLKVAASTQGEAVTTGTPCFHRLGPSIALVGYDLSATQVPAGGQLQVTLYWQGLASPSRDYTVFLHLSGGGDIQAQRDGQPLGGDYPTSAWAPGDIVGDAHSLEVGLQVPPGRYALEVGLYDLATRERLPVSNGEESSGDHITLAQIEVTAP